MLLAGLEVSAVRCSREKGQWLGGQAFEGKEIVVWCEVVGVTQLRHAPVERKLAIEVRLWGSDPRRVADDLGSAASSPTRSSSIDTSRCTRLVDGGSDVEFKESLFLPTKYSKASFLQLVLCDESIAGPGIPLAHALLTMPQALRVNRQ